MELPQHLAIIMDGNGRWAQARGLPRIAGHQQGVRTVREVVKYCTAAGIAYLTLYAFSSENWRRPKEEVEALMSLLATYLDNETELLTRNGIRLNVIGDMTKLPDNVVTMLRKTMAATAGNGGMVLTLALSYGARDEIVRATRRIAADVAAGRMAVEQVDEDVFATYLDSADIPSPDLLIRTSGEMRISNFLLWQLAYAELYFCSCYWPEFDVEQLQSALDDYAGRCRRFGAIEAARAEEKENSH